MLKMLSNKKSIKRRKVFFIDDNQPLLNLYSSKFTQEGFDVKTSSRPKEVIADVSVFKPDIIFLDLVMSGRDGLEILRQLKSTLVTKWTPVVMLTNMDSTIDKKRCFDYGASDYLVKVNVTPEELAVYARGVLRRL